MPLFTLTILRKQLKKQTELAKKGLLPRTHFPNASERYESPDGRLNIFYNEGSPEATMSSTQKTWRRKEEL